MSYLQELDRLERTIKEAEIRLKQIKSSMDVMEKEIDQLTSLEAQLEQNLNFLKKKHVIALAAEFRKAKISLTNTKNRLAFLRIDRENVRRAHADTEMFIFKCQESYVTTMNSSANNVINVDFVNRRRHG